MSIFSPPALKPHCVITHSLNILNLNGVHSWSFIRAPLLTHSLTHTLLPQLPSHSHSQLPSSLTNYPTRMRRGKVISLSVCLSVITTKIAKSRNLGLRATHKCNQSVEIGERLA